MTRPLSYYLTLLLCLISTLSNAQSLKTDISVHDPVMIKQDSVYHLYCTGRGISAWSSTDMQHWKAEPPIFAQPPQWALEAVPGFKGHIWAPDISFYNGLYYLYYSVSAFGKNTSCIGVATNKTLNTASPDYHWVDHGKLIQSIPKVTNWNAIDPNLITEKDGTPYLAFGSFWDGLKLIKLNQDRVSLAQPTDNLPTIARHKPSPTGILKPGDFPADAGTNAIEGPFVFKHNKYFYLFVSVDYCCRGPKSTYKMLVGRSKKVTGPYTDQSGKKMDQGGGTLVLEGDSNWYGVGHNAVCRFDSTDYLIYHGYDAADKGISKLLIKKLSWTNGWPVAEQTQSALQSTGH
jgi:arabinan endo-1,5-alpha-L-arabinosidase